MSYSKNVIPEELWSGVTVFLGSYRATGVGKGGRGWRLESCEARQGVWGGPQGGAWGRGLCSRSVLSKSGSGRAAGDSRALHLPCLRPECERPGGFPISPACTPGRGQTRHRRCTRPWQPSQFSEESMKQLPLCPAGLVARLSKVRVVPGWPLNSRGSGS